uniref:Uncharacterized protein n=1 Tax=Tetradesmus obliquus TaxID=3088 RepID=A0A383VF72_TETOB|eukprot:jgi/Sobl393_1/1566/SZX64177.1
MERTPAAAAAAAAAAPGNSNGEVHVVPAKPAIFQNATALQIVFAKLAPRDLCALVQSACSYTRQRPDYFFRCKLLQLEWLRCDNSLRLWFDARGEADLRHPMSSSLAVITLSPAIQRHTTPAAAVAAGPGSAAAGAVCLNWEMTLAVCSPDDCQLIVSTHGHNKGVLVWHSGKCSSILSLLLQSQPQRIAPPEQHLHVQRSRRSEAWEDWAGWALDQEQQQQQQEVQHAAAAGAGTSNSSSSRSTEGRLMSMLHAAVGWGAGQQQQQQQQQQAALQQDSCSSSTVHGRRLAQAATAASAEPGVAQVGLVFCYANNLAQFTTNDWRHSGLQPDYRPTLLVASPGQAAAAAAAAATQPHPGVCSASRAACSSAAATSSATAHMATAAAAGGSAGAAAALAAGSQTPVVAAVALPLAELQLPVQLHHPQEAHWASAWLRLPGACVLQRGLLEQQLRAESDADEKARWADLPQAVQRRGAAWWK